MGASITRPVTNTVQRAASRRASPQGRLAHTRHGRHARGQTIPPDPPAGPDTDAGHRIAAALPGLALGDALGAPFEGRRGVARDEVIAWSEDGRPLIWTDDTHMALALAETLLEQDRPEDLDPERLGAAFARAHADEPWRGYGAGPPQVFAMARDGDRYVDAAASLFGGSGSFGNGAAMRVAPVAIAAHADVEVVARLAEQQALPTHSHREAIEGAVLVATATALLARHGPAAPPTTAIAEACGRLPQGSIRAATSLLLQHADDPEALVARAVAMGTGVAARESVPAAIAAVLAAETVVDVLVTAIELGGDTDTVAAMAGTMAAARTGPSGLPRPLLARLEARERLVDLAERLASRDGRRRGT